MRHPERGLLHALLIASVGFVLVPCVSSAVLILWVRTGGDSIQAAFVSIFVFFFGFGPSAGGCGAPHEPRGQQKHLSPQWLTLPLDLI